MLKQIDHIALAVHDLDEGIKRYERLFQITIDHIEVAEEISTKIAFFQVGEVMIELVAPMLPGKGPVATFLDEYGEGFQHIAFRVQDLNATLESLKKRCPYIQHDKPRYGAGEALISFLDSKKTGNVLIELVERKNEPVAPE